MNEDHGPQGGGDLGEERGRRGGLFQRFGQRLQKEVESGRGGEYDDNGLSDAVPLRPVAQTVAHAQPQVRAEEPAVRRQPKVEAPPKATRMVVPDGVHINGSVTSPADAEIAGKIDGDVSVDGILYLASSALITGNVKAASCRVEGLVAGTVECSQDLEIGETGRLNADASAGRRINLAGEVTGNINTGGIIKLLPTARVSGDIRARSFVIEEGAFFNGKCTMRSPAEKQAQPAQKE